MFSLDFRPYNLGRIKSAIQFVVCDLKVGGKCILKFNRKFFFFSENFTS